MDLLTHFYPEKRLIPFNFLKIIKKTFYFFMVYQINFMQNHYNKYQHTAYNLLKALFSIGKKIG